MAHRINVTNLVRNSNLDELDDLADIVVHRMEKAVTRDRFVKLCKTFDNPKIEMRKAFHKSRRDWETHRSADRKNLSITSEIDAIELVKERVG
jgi:hypothetical protein